jgi:magnesium-transporting ATPase (P-type)
MAGLLNLAPATCPGTGWPRRGHWPRGPLVLVFAAVAFATGADTQFGQICQMTAQVTEVASPLQRNANRMARQVSAVAVALAALVFGLRTSGS